MKKLFAILSFLIGSLLFTTSCSTVPVTGRSQLSLIPVSTMLSMSFQEYGSFLKENKLSTDAKAMEKVKLVGGKIKTSVEEYMRQNNMSDRLQGYKWDFNLVQSEDVNAWCMPGGKVVIYTGILPITKDETGLAVVMGHEIAHAIAEHGNERMSQGLLQQLGGMALDVALQNEPQATRDLWLTVYGVGTTVGLVLPYSRLQESEADKLGLIFMAMSGYDPNTAVGFWQNMAELNAGQAPPEFLSTHPSDATRIKDIKAALPEALKYYKKP
ncbi:MAG: M48 family metallopeptidase [bacterium]